MQVNLKTARDRKGWSLEQAAQESGINKSTISRLERGLMRPSLDTAIALEKAYGLKRGTLTFGPRERISA